MKNELPKGNAFRSGISTKGVTYGLCTALSSVLCVAVLIAVDETTRAAQQPVMRHREGGRKIALGQPSRYHLFLSHVWSTGQDQMLAVKKELQLLVPGIRIFLDIEDLAGVGGLESEIEGTDMHLIFLSRGYFSSFNCRREVRHAVHVHTSPQEAALLLARQQDSGGGDGDGEGLEATSGPSRLTACRRLVQQRQACGLAPDAGSIILMRETDTEVGRPTRR